MIDLLDKIFMNSFFAWLLMFITVNVLWFVMERWSMHRDLERDRERREKEAAERERTSYFDSRI